jgi:hypothetical protein
MQRTWVGSVRQQYCKAVAIYCRPSHGAWGGWHCCYGLNGDMMTMMTAGHFALCLMFYRSVLTLHSVLLVEHL